MNQKLKKVKTFMKEHKKEIFIATMSSVVGVTVGVSICKSLDKDVVKIKWGKGNMAMAKSLIPSIANKSKFKDFGWPYDDLTIGELGDYGKELIDIYDDITKDTKVNGILVLAD